MAVTKIWPVKGRLDAVIRHAGNEEKARLPDPTGLSAGKDDLSDVLQYAANDAKTTRESQLFVSGVNCVPEIARQQMELTKQQFGKTGGTVAFHAYQSFRPGEVTPEQCRNRLRRCRDPTECESLHTKKDELTKQITETRS